MGRKAFGVSIAGGGASVFALAEQDPGFAKLYFLLQQELLEPKYQVKGFTLPEVVLVLVFSRVVFGVTSAGSYLAIGLLILLGALTFSGIGLLVASRAQTIETVSGLMNAVMLPMWIGSGIFFSTDRFPEAVQPLLRLLPLTPLIHALRGVMLEGTSLLALGLDLTILVAWGGITFVLALRWFRWS